jgi:Bacterial Ig-like domain
MLDQFRLILLAAVLVGLGAGLAPAEDEAGSPPRVVRMLPDNGAVDVDPGRTEIVITFSEPMKDRCWSICGGGPNFPKIKGIEYTKDCTVLVVSVALKPGWTYSYSLNSQRNKGFKSRKGIPLAPLAVTFTTTGATPGEVKPVVEDAGKATFELEDVNGLTVTSRDYIGVPIFIVFGAAW